MQGLKRVVKEGFPQPVTQRVLAVYRRARFGIGCRQTARFAARIARRKGAAAPCVVFLIGMPEVWNSLRSVFEAALARKDTRAYVVALPKLRDSVTGTQAFDNPAYEYLRQCGTENLIRAYDDATGAWFDLRSLRPDYAVYTRPYLHEYSPAYAPKAVRAYAKVCLIPYAYNMLENDVARIVFNDRFVSNCSMIFLASASRLAECAETFAKPCKRGALKLFYRGFPRCDLLRERPDSLGGRRTSGARLRVLWLPRWTVDSDCGSETSHFLRYGARFLDFFAAHPSLELMIRPHPNMFDNFVRKGRMTEQDVQAFFARCQGIPNVRLHRDSDYLTAFAWSDILVADYTSLLMEYYITGKPIILCERSENLSVEGARMQHTLDIADTWGEIEALLLRFAEGNAPAQRDRAEVLEMVLPSPGTHVGETILACMLEN